MKSTLSHVDLLVKKEFELNKRVLSFDEYLVLVTKDPERQMRASARYLLDMMDHFGKSPAEGSNDHFNLFDFPIDGTTLKLIGHEDVQTQVYRTLKSFVRLGTNNQLILLHGPNGSAKSTLCHSLMGAMERYSNTDEGAVYTYSWVFPTERSTKGGMGINKSYAGSQTPDESYAHVSDENIAAKIPCELKDHPLLLVPKELRKDFVSELLGQAKGEKIWKSLSNYLVHGELSHRDQEIFQALLSAYNGDFKKVLQHIQVERFYYSRRYRKGVVTIEPQMHVDAEYQLLTMNKSLSSLPASLMGINLFQVRGDLVDGNRGIIEYSDLLKRPIDAFKYLLGACESSSVNVGATIVHLDSIMIASSNELQLDAFKEFPDFSSFKARIKLIRVPYLMSYTKEQEIYESLLPQLLEDKPISPHVSWTLALWAVLSRLKKPNSVNFPPSIHSIISAMTPLEKAKLYDNGSISETISPEERKILKASISKLKNEYSNIPYYEGRMGASVREIKTILFDAINNPDHESLTPLAVFQALEEFTKRISEYEFLKQDIKEGYHDCVEYIQVVQNEYLNIIDREIRSCMGLYDSQQWEDFIKKYVIQVAALLKGEKLPNPITGKLSDPDRSLIEEFEKIVGAPTGLTEIEGFRKNVISQVGAWSLDHRSEKVVYSKVFPEYWTKLEKFYYESQKSILNKMYKALLVYGTDSSEKTSEGAILAQKTIENMIKLKGYTEGSARDVITFLMKRRYG